MRDLPRVAVVIPCMNDGELVLEAVGSIRESEPVEIVVVDDGSDDPTTQTALETLELNGVMVERHGRNRGVSEARNSGLRATGAPYVLPLDSDDLLYPGSLPQMANVLDANPEAAACFGDYIEFGAHLLIRGVPNRIDPYRIAHTNEYPPSALHRRAVLEEIGGWHRVGRKIDARSDWNLWMTLAERGEAGLHLGRDRFTYLRRIHHGRLAEAGRRYHRDIYRGLRASHPRLFAELRQSRKTSELSATRKLLFPFFYGARAWWPVEPSITRRFDQKGVGRVAYGRGVPWLRDDRLRPVRGEDAERLSALVAEIRSMAGTRFPPAGDAEAPPRRSLQAGG